MVLLEKTVAGDVGDSLVPPVESELAVRVGRALAGPAPAGVVPQNEDQELVVGELELVEVLTAAEPGGQFVVEPAKDESEPERQDVVVPRGRRWYRPPAAAQASCPDSTKGRPGNHSWIEFVRT